MNRRVFASIVPGLAALAVFACSPGSTQPPPSVLLITIDTLRADRVGAYGSTLGLTPTLDRLAKEGWLFENAVSPVPLTLPAHATILSGLDPRHHGVRNNGTYVFPQDRETLATRLKAQGYRTGAFVSAVVLDRRFGLARGFDVYDDRIGRVTEGRSVLESERPCEEVTRRAIAWMRSTSGPMFGWVHLYEPHAPYSPPADLAAAHPGQPYEAEVAAADRCLAGLVAAAEGARPGRLLTMVTSDHGEGLGDHGETAHGLFVYQSTLRVPMIVAGAGVPSGKRSPGLARSADIAPTLLAILGVPLGAPVDGVDLTGSRGAGESYAETDYPTGFGWAPLRSWRLGDLKLIDAPDVELYDLSNDPQEDRNLAASKPKDVDRLRAVLHAALATEVRADPRRSEAAVEERLRSLGYVAGGASSGPGAGSAMDPKKALPLLRDFERALEAEARGDLTSSAAILRGLVKRDPSSLAFQRSLASALRRGGRLGEALSVLRKAAEAAPKDAAIAHDLAIALAEQGLDVQAIEWEERAVAIDHRFVEALVHLAALHAGRGDFVQARNVVDRAVAEDANNASAWSNRGNIARGQGVVDEAERSYTRALELSPDLVDAVNGLGVIAVERGRLDEAAARFARAIELDATLDEARLNLAVVEAQRGHRQRAIELATETSRVARDRGLRSKASAFLRDLQSASR